MVRRDKLILTLIAVGFLTALGYWVADGRIGGTVGGGMAAGLVVAAYLLWADRLLAVVFGRVLLALVPLVALSSLGIYWIVLQVPREYPIKAALISGVVIATGWIATWLASEYQRDRSRDQTRRETLYALRSEIFTAFQTLDSIDWLENARVVQAHIRTGGDDENTRYHPFVGTESPPIVFQAVSGSINLLPEGTLEPILRFYSALNDLATLGSDLRGVAFSKLDTVRRIGGHIRLTDTRVATLKWAIQSIIAIDTALGVNNPHIIKRNGNNAQLKIAQRDGQYVVIVDETEGA